MHGHPLKDSCQLNVRLRACLHNSRSSKLLLLTSVLLTTTLSWDFTQQAPAVVSVALLSNTLISKSLSQRHSIPIYHVESRVHARQRQSSLQKKTKIELSGVDTTDVKPSIVKEKIKTPTTA